MESYKDIKVGDIVTAYSPGYHRVIRIEARAVDFRGGGTDSPLVYYRPLMNGKYGKGRNEECTCDITFCRPAGPQIEKAIAELNKNIETLKQFQFDYDL